MGKKPIEKKLKKVEPKTVKKTTQETTKPERVSTQKTQTKPLNKRIVKIQTQEELPLMPAIDKKVNLKKIISSKKSQSSIRQAPPQHDITENELFESIEQQAHIAHEKPLEPLQNGKKRVVMITSEAHPYAKSGGLADVAASLPVALSKRGHEVSVIMPFYPQQMKKYCEQTSVCYEILPVPFGHWQEFARIRKIEVKKNLTFYFIEFNKYFDRPGLYDYNNVEFGDNAARFIFFCRAAMETIIALRLYPDIIHTHDWHAALANIYAISDLYVHHPIFTRTKTALTIHNLGYQGNFDKGNFYLTGLNWNYFNFNCLEFHDRINLLKGAIMCAHMVSTVSPTYAEEILGEEQGFSLDATLRHCASRGRLRGILNGIDVQEWNPEIDPLIPATFNSEEMNGKIICKAALQKQFGLEQNPSKPLIGVVSRLASQKGIDVFLAAIGSLINENRVQVCILGAGDPSLHAWIDSYAKTYPGRFGAFIGYNAQLSHLIEAGCDFFAMPSRYEPCGLNQMYSMRYGTLPIVRATGGLADTVFNYNPNTPELCTGFNFNELSTDALRNTLYWAVNVYETNPHAIWLMRQKGMRTDFSWDSTARHYEDLYEEATLQ